MTEKIRVLRGRMALEVLERACAERCELKVKIPEVPGETDSRIFDLLGHKGRFDIHRFSSDEANRAMHDGVQVEVRMVLQERMFSFPAKCLEAIGVIPSHHLSIPTMIQEVQRRAYFRIAPPNAKAVSLRVRYETSERVARAKVAVVNISGSGVLFYDRNLQSPPEAGENLGLVLRLGTRLEYKIQGKVARWKDPPGKLTRGFHVGVQFEDLDPNVEKLLMRTLMTWERQLRRDRMVD